MAIKLKPCPFCRGVAEMKTAQHKDIHKVSCADLTCIGSYIYLWHPTQEEAATVWNRRAGDEQT